MAQDAARDAGNQGGCHINRRCNRGDADGAIDCDQQDALGERVREIDRIRRIAKHEP